MALLYQCNGLERANPHWHTNQSLSITMMTDFPIINNPAVPHIKSYPHSFLHVCRWKNCRDVNIFSFTFTEEKVNLTSS